MASWADRKATRLPFFLIEAARRAVHPKKNARDFGPPASDQSAQAENFAGPSVKGHAQERIIAGQFLDAQ
jgi:hypothetical protein